MNLPDRNVSLPITICAISLCLSALLFASNFKATREKSQADSIATHQMLSPSGPATPSPTPFCPPVITQSTSQEITTTQPACRRPDPTAQPPPPTPPIGQYDNHYWRAFNMAALTGGAQYDVTSV